MTEHGNAPAAARQTGEAAASAPSLAYLNEDFLNSPDGRIVRIVAEYEEPLARLRRQKIQDTVVFFGSARTKAPENAVTDADRRMSRYYSDAQKLAGMMTEWAQQFGGEPSRYVVTSGGGPGIMEAANRGAYEAGGKTIGFNIRLPFEQSANPYISPGLNFEFHYFFMRKLWFAYLAKAIVVFPGGFGTLDEMFEIVTLAQTHKLAKEMVIVVYGSDYWKPLLNYGQLIEDGTIAAADMELFQFADTPEEAFALLRDGLVRTEANGQRPAREMLRTDVPEIAPTNSRGA